MQLEERCVDERKARDRLNATYLELIEKQRAYYKTVKDFQEVTCKAFLLALYMANPPIGCVFGLKCWL